MNRKSINLATGRLNARTLQIAGVVRAVAEECGVSPAQVALAWTLLNPGVTSTILGVRNLEQLEDNLAALDLDLSGDQVRRLDEVSRVEAGFPHDMLNSPVAREMFGAVDIEVDRG